MSERFELQEGEENLAALFASAESGMTEIPDEVEVDDIEQILQHTGMSPEALEQFRVSSSAN